MTPRTLISAAAGGIILMGCAYPWPSITSSAECTVQHCEVAISANQHDMPSFGCFVDRADPYTLVVKHARPVNVAFRLDAGSAQNGYAFAPNGIVFDDPSGWTCPQIPANAKLAVCTNAAGPGNHKYTVNLVKGSAPCEPHDPFVVNQ